MVKTIVVYVHHQVIHMN